MSERFIEIGLGVVFAALLGIQAAVGYFGIQALDTNPSQARSIANNEWVDVQLADEALAYSNRNSRINLQLLETTSPSHIESLITQRDENSNKISAVIRRLQTRVGSDAEQETLDQVLETRETYTRSYRAVTDLLLRHKTGQARDCMQQETSILLVKYHAAWNDFVSFQTREMNNKLMVKTRPVRPCENTRFA